MTPICSSLRHACEEPLALRELTGDVIVSAVKQGDGGAPPRVAPLGVQHTGEGRQPALEAV